MSIFSDLNLLIVTFLPGRIGTILRRHYYMRRLRQCGTSLLVEIGTIIENPELCTFGNNVHIDKYCLISGTIHIGNTYHVVQNCILDGKQKITLESNGTLSAGTKIFSSIEDSTGAVHLHENVWCGVNTTILPGVTIGKNSFTTTGTVVEKSFEENSYLSGNPAAKLRKRFEENSGKLK